MNKTTIPFPKILISLVIYFVLPLSAVWLNRFVDSLTITYTLIYSATALILVIINWNVFSLHLQRFSQNIKDCLLFTLICLIAIIVLQLGYHYILKPGGMIVEREILLHYTFFIPAMVLAYSLCYAVSFTLAFKIFVDRIHLQVNESMTILISGFLFGFLCTVGLLPSTFDQFLRLFGYFFLTSTLASYAYNQTHSIIPMTLAYSLVLLGNILLILI
ncbi:hypothetical protein [Holdemania massiliensis]|uniref:hypothetical protein n=1 Tax=Holdemania massiliensis TaxID=1468449 RepID=UPI001F06646F|nr:hypothetical protein [Holdemania massiliensis]MCH1941516.1 hypothetical protein [Holdemania massiliensis]